MGGERARLIWHREPVACAGTVALSPSSQSPPLELSKKTKMVFFVLGGLS